MKNVGKIVAVTRRTSFSNVFRLQKKGGKGQQAVKLIQQQQASAGKSKEAVRHLSSVVAFSSRLTSST
jgi:hypothetical protein